MKTVTQLFAFLLLVCFVAECRSYEDPRCAPPAHPQHMKKVEPCAKLISKYAWNRAIHDCALLRYHECFDTGKHFSQISDCRKHCTPESSEEDDLITYIYHNVFE